LPWNGGPFKKRGNPQGSFAREGHFCRGLGEKAIQSSLVSYLIRKGKEILRQSSAMAHGPPRRKETGGELRFRRERKWPLSREQQEGSIREEQFLRRTLYPEKRNSTDIRGGLGWEEVANYKGCLQREICPQQSYLNRGKGREKFIEKSRPP